MRERALASRLGGSLRCAASLLLVALLGARGAAGAQVPRNEGAQRLDGLAALVGGLAPGPGVISIFRSDVELRARMALLREGTLADALGTLPSGLLGASLKELVGEGLIAAEAERLSLPPPTERALAEHRLRLLAASGPDGSAPELVRALGVSERELAAWIRRRAVVSAFLEANLEGTLEVSAAELERRFRAEPHPFQGEPFAAARARFGEWLRQQRMALAVEHWVQSLAQRLPHRVLVSY